MSAPALKVQVQGVTTVSADNLNTYEQTCDTVSELTNFVGVLGIQVYARGLVTIGDGGQGEFYWAIGSYTNDGVNTIVPPGVTSGAWLRLGSGIGNVIAYVTSITALRQIPPAAAATTQIVYVQTQSLTGAVYLWGPSVSTADNGLTVIQPNASIGNGRWVLAGSNFAQSESATSIGAGINESTGHLAIGGYPDLNQPADEPGGIEQISTDGNITCLATTGYGTNANAILHFYKARGTQDAPTAPLSGDNILSVGARAYNPATNNFAGSSFAWEVYLTENASGYYSGTYHTIEGTITGSGIRTEWVRFINGFVEINNAAGVSYNSQLTVLASSSNVCAQFLNSSGQAFAYTGNNGQTMLSGENAANAGLYIRKDSATSRSINAAGTINASGADYAEFEVKADGCSKISKGQIIGFDVNGKITDKWANAISFGIKSTNPAYVGGDIWHKNIARPQMPAEPVIAKNPTDQQRADHAEAVAAHRIATVAHQAKLAEFEATHEILRRNVDRIAYSGKVPVNVIGAKPGDYIVASQSGDDIGAEIVGKPTFEQYQSAVGRVRKILEDGRAEVVVIVH